MTNTTERPPNGPERTLTLTDFLLARIAEDEADALDRGIHPGAPSGGVGASLTSWEQRRWLAECEAKRRIVEAYLPGASPAMDSVDGELVILPLLALPYADHPDYRDEWRP